MIESSIVSQSSKPFISVIIPVYNVENYLEECFDSIINQTYKNIEIIVVDDGSLDSSKEICDAYADKYKQFNVIHQKNAGVSEARNTAINEASGKYLLFVDSDDMLADCTVIENLVEFLQRTNAKITYCTSVIRFHEVIPAISEKTDVDTKDNPAIFTPNELLSYAKRNHTFLASCSFVVAREYIINYQLFFRKGIAHEDTEWIPRILYSEEEQKVYLFTKPFYLYRFNSCSITSSLSQQRCDSMFLILSELFERILVSSKYEKKFLKKWLNRYLFFLCMFFEKECIGNTVFYKKNFEKVKQIFKNYYGILSLRNRILFVFIQTYPKLFFFLRMVIRRG